jgi:hypothetical protein
VVDEVWYLAAPGLAQAVERAVRSVRAHDRVRVFAVDRLDAIDDLVAKDVPRDA